MRPCCPDCWGRSPADQPISKVSADGAFDTRACHAAIVARGANAVIPTRRNGRPAAMADLGKRIRPGPMPATTSSAPPAASGE